MIGIVVFVHRRRRQGKPRPISGLSDSTEDVSQMIMTPFLPIPSGETLDRGTWTRQLPPSQAAAPVPTGLSGKEIARLRAEALSSQTLPDPSALNVSQSTSSSNAVNEPGGTTSTYDPQRLHTEVESLVRREMERLRAEVLVTEAPSGAPPSYAEGDGQ